MTNIVAVIIFCVIVLLLVILFWPGKMRPCPEMNVCTMVKRV